MILVIIISTRSWWHFKQVMKANELSRQTCMFYCLFFHTDKSSKRYVNKLWNYQLHLRRKDRYKYFVVEILSRYISESEIEWAILFSQRASLIVVVVSFV